MHGEARAVEAEAWRRGRTPGSLTLFEAANPGSESLRRGVAVRGHIPGLTTLVAGSRGAVARPGCGFAVSSRSGALGTIFVAGGRDDCSIIPRRLVRLLVRRSHVGEGVVMLIRNRLADPGEDLIGRFVCHLEGASPVTIYPETGGLQPSTVSKATPP